MGDAYVRVPADSVGKRVDATSLDVGADTVYRQRIVIGDNSATAQFAVVTGGALVCTGTFNISTMPSVSLAAGAILDSISATVGVKGQVSLAAGTANIGFINNISATVVVAGNVNISATATVVIGAVLDSGGSTQVKFGDSANSALRVNVVAGSTGGVSQIDGTTFSTQAANFVPIGGIFDDTLPDTLSENDAGVCRVTTNRALHVNLRTADGSEISAGNALSVKVERISATASVVLAAGAANVGTINNISATVAITGTVALAAGTVINNISATVIVAGVVSLGAGTANIGSINNISATVTVAGNVNISATPSVILAAGTANFGTLNNISATVVVAGVVALTAGTAVIGDLNAISRTVQVAIGTPFTLQGISTTVIVAMSNQTLQGISTTVTVAGVVGLTAGTANIGFINNISATVIAVLNTSAAIPSVSRGPLCVTASTSAGVALISAPGAGNFIYITQIACTNGSGTLTRADVFAASQTATCIAQMYMAASGGGFVLKYDPPVRVQSNTQVTCRVDPNVSQAIFNVHFYVQST